MPLSLRQDLIYQKLNFLMIQTYFPGDTVGLPLFSEIHLFIGAGYMCPCLSSEGELFDDSSLPSRKHHRSRSPQDEEDSYQLELHPSHVEMLNAIRGRLHLEVPQVECFVAPVFS